MNVRPSFINFHDSEPDKTLRIHYAKRHMNNVGAICRDLRSRSINILEFGVNILCSAEQSSAYCHYSSFFGRNNHSIFTPRGDIEYQKYTVKYTPLHLSTMAPKTWNNDGFSFNMGHFKG